MGTADFDLASLLLSPSPHLHARGPNALVEARRGCVEDAGSRKVSERKVLQSSCQATHGHGDRARGHERDGRVLVCAAGFTPELKP